jgi:hypothetical protein
MPLKSLIISGTELKDGDRITFSNRYKYKVRGLVKLNVIANGVAFLVAPTLDQEDVAFTSTDRVTVTREVPANG